MGAVALIFVFENFKYKMISIISTKKIILKSLYILNKNIVDQ